MKHPLCKRTESFHNLSSALLSSLISLLSTLSYFNYFQLSSRSTYVSSAHISSEQLTLKLHYFKMELAVMRQHLPSGVHHPDLELSFVNLGAGFSFLFGTMI